MTARCAFFGVLALGAVALAQPTPDDKPLSMKYDGARQEGPIGVRPVVILDDASQARGHVPISGEFEAVVFDQPNDSGFGWFMKSDDTLGYGTWASQARFANGWRPGYSVSSYTVRFVHSTSDDESYGDATVSTELWNGDPFSIMETPCAGGNGGINTPIAGTQAVFSGLDYGTVFDLTAQLRTKVAVDCDRVWIAMTFVEGCHGAWRIAGKDGGMWNAPATMGFNNGVWLLWACEQFGSCDTETGYNSGTCCAFGSGDPGEVCDHARVDGVGNLLDPCATEAAAGLTFCGDGVADYFIANINEPGLFRGLVSTVSAATDTIVQLVPVSVDAPPGAGGPSTGVISLSGNDLVLSEGDHNVWLEFRIGDWDSADAARRLRGWLLKLDASSLASGAQGELTAHTAGGAGTCASDADCAALLGPPGSCDPPGYYKTAQLGAGVCSYLFIDSTRDDFVYSADLGTQGAILVTDVSVINVRPAAKVIVRGPDDPEPFPEGGLYAATLTLHVPADAKGTFTLDLFPFPDSQLVISGGEFAPLLGVIPANIRVQTGRCCFNLELKEGAGCVDTLFTAATCLEGPGDTVFTPNGSCNESTPCPACSAIDPPVDPPVESHTLNDKNRYLTFVPTNLGFDTALQVTLVESEQFPEAVGSTWWVGEPDVFCENGGEVNPPCTPVPDVPSDTFLSASLQCAQHCMDWGSLGEPVHVGDINIVPGASYEVRAIPCGCDPGNPANFSDALSVSTSVWGDTVVSCAECPCGPPEGIVNIIDCREVVQRFINAPCKPLKSRVDLEPAIPDRQINITDVLACIQGFLGLEYDLSVPIGCAP